MMQHAVNIPTSEMMRVPLNTKKRTKRPVNRVRNNGRKTPRIYIWANQGFEPRWLPGYVFITPILNVMINTTTMLISTRHETSKLTMPIHFVGRYFCSIIASALRTTKNNKPSRGYRR